MPFEKGHIGYNKGKKLCGEYRNCLRCNKEMWVVQSRILNGGGKYCSRDCSNKSTAKRGEESHNYKKKVGYHGVHSWLYTNYGKASECENCGKKERVQWAKLKDKSYERKRENFIQLCCWCHIDYDGTKVLGGWNKGKSWSKETKRKISVGTKIGMKKAGYNVKGI